MALAVEPMVVLGDPGVHVLDDDWTVVASDGSHASHWEHTVALHSRGVWVLTEPDGGVAKLAEIGVTAVPLS